MTPPTPASTVHLPLTTTTASTADDDNILSTYVITNATTTTSSITLLVCSSSVDLQKNDGDETNITAQPSVPCVMRYVRTCYSYFISMLYKTRALISKRCENVLNLYRKRQCRDSSAD